MSEKYDAICKTDLKGNIKAVRFNNGVTNDDGFLNELYHLFKKHNMSFVNLPVRALSKNEKCRQDNK